MVRGWPALVLAVAVVAGCVGGPGSELRSQWEAEASAHAPFGVPARLDVTGTFTLQGELSADLAAPFSLRVAKALGGDRPYVLLHNARVVGVGNGTVVLEGATVAVAGGHLTGGAFARAVPGVGVDLYGRDDPHLATHSVRDVPGWEGVDDLDRLGVTMQGSLRDAELSGFTRAALLRGREAVPLESPVRVSAEGLGMAEGTAIRVASARVAASQFHLGGDMEGTVVPEDGAAILDPGAVSGRDASFAAGPGALASEGSFRLTQAVQGGRPVRDARMELALASPAVTLHEGVGHVEVSYRERSFGGDAVLSAVRLRGAPTGTHLIVSAAPTPLAHAVPGVRTEGPVVAGATCWLLCGLGATSLPAWIDAGGVAAFHIQVKGAAGQDVAFTLELEGNFPAVAFPVSVRLAAPAAAPAPAQAGAEPRPAAAPDKGGEGFPLWAATAIAVALSVAVAASWLVASRSRRSRAAIAPAAPPPAAPPAHPPGTHPVRRVPVDRRP